MRQDSARGHIQIDWRLARALLDVIGEAEWQHDPKPLGSAKTQIYRVLEYCARTKQTKKLEIDYFRREFEAVGRLFIKALVLVAERGGRVGPRASFWTNKIAGALGLSVIDRIGLLDEGAVA